MDAHVKVYLWRKIQILAKTDKRYNTIRELALSKKADWQDIQIMNDILTRMG